MFNNTFFQPVLENVRNHFINILNSSTMNFKQLKIIEHSRVKVKFKYIGLQKT